MVDRLLAAFSECDEILLSVRDEKQLSDLNLLENRNPPAGSPGIRRVTDPVSGAGPLAGIVASLRACRHELLFVTAVDMPYMDRNFAEELLSVVEKKPADWDVLVPVDPDGRQHPLCAFYKKSALPVLEESLRDGTYSLWRNFQKLHICRIPAEILEDSARKLMNLNRPEDVTGGKQFMIQNSKT